MVDLDKELACACRSSQDSESVQAVLNRQPELRRLRHTILLSFVVGRLEALQMTWWTGGSHGSLRRSIIIFLCTENLLQRLITLSNTH